MDARDKPGHDDPCEAGDKHAGGPYRGEMDRRILRDFRALRGQAGRHRGDPVGDAVARAQCPPCRTRIAADGRQAVSHRRADAAQPRGGSGPLHRRQHRHSKARARRHGVAAGRLRGRLHHRRADARRRDAGNSQGRRAHSQHIERTSGSARAHGARHRVGEAGPCGRKNAARNQADACHLQSGYRTRRRHGRRLDRRRLGLDRPAGYAGALARRHRRQLSQEQDRQRHHRDGGRRHQSHLQALSDLADQDDAEGRLRHGSRGRGRGCGDDARPISRRGATARPMRYRMSAGA